MASRRDARSDPSLRWNGWASRIGCVFSAFAPLWRAYEMEEDPPVQSVLRETGRDAVTKAHVQLEAALSNGEWLAGPRKTLADAYFIGLARWGKYHRVVAPGDEQRRLRGHIELQELLPRLAA